MVLKSDLDYVEFYARKMKDDKRIFVQQKKLIEAQFRASRSLFGRMFGKEFKKGAREYLRKRGLI